MTEHRITDQLARERVVNRFKECATAEEVVFQAIGAGSMCWENVRAAGVFDSDEAKRIGNDAVARLNELDPCST